MKNSTDLLPDESVIKLEVCSKQACVTCFEYSGCMYEQLLGASLHHIEESHPENQLNDEAQINKRA